MKQAYVATLLRPVALLLLTVLATASSAEPAVTPEMARTAKHLIAQASANNRAYDIVESLTTEVGPRLAGTEAEARAREWAVKKLESLGFANVRVEPFEVPLWLRGEERAEIVSPFPQALEVTTLGGSIATPPKGVEAEVVAFESLAALKFAPAGSLAGKIAFVDEPMARSRDGSGYGLAVRKRLGTAFAAEKGGAVAALIRSVGTSTHRFAHTGAMRLANSEPEAGVPTAALSAPDADQLSRALGYGKPVVVKLVLAPQSLPPVPSGNVVAELIGREAPEEIVLVGAHLDSWDLGTGAVDDGAGVGIVVGAVKVLMEHLEQPPRRTVRLVLFGSEEVGYVGAKAYTEKYADELGNHVIAAESDFGAGDIWRFDTRVGELKLPYMEEVGEVLAPLGIEPGNNEARGGPDLIYLRGEGVPMVSLFQDGQDYFDLHHTADDTLDKIAVDGLDQNVAAYAAVLYLLAEMEVEFR